MALIDDLHLQTRKYAMLKEKVFLQNSCEEERYFTIYLGGTPSNFNICHCCGYSNCWSCVDGIEMNVIWWNDTLAIAAPKHIEQSYKIYENWTRKEARSLK